MNKDNLVFRLAFALPTQCLVVRVLQVEVQILSIIACVHWHIKLCNCILYFFHMVGLGACDQYRTQYHHIPCAFMPCTIEISSNGGFKWACNFIYMKRAIPRTHLHAHLKVSSWALFCSSKVAKITPLKYLVYCLILSRILVENFSLKNVFSISYFMCLKRI